MSKPANKPMREAMPTVAAFVDSMRAAFGADAINGQIKKGMNGIPVFWASENGHEIGTRPLRVGVEVSVGDMCLKPAEPLVAARKKRYEF